MDELWLHPPWAPPWDAGWRAFTTKMTWRFFIGESQPKPLFCHILPPLLGGGGRCKLQPTKWTDGTQHHGDLTVRLFSDLHFRVDFWVALKKSKYFSVSEAKTCYKQNVKDWKRLTKIMRLRTIQDDHLDDEWRWKWKLREVYTQSQPQSNSHRLGPARVSKLCVTFSGSNI